MERYSSVALEPHLCSLLSFLAALPFLFIYLPPLKAPSIMSLSLSQSLSHPGQTTLKKSKVRKCE